jgi:hypothetical protein
MVENSNSDVIPMSTVDDMSSPMFSPKSSVLADAITAIRSSISSHARSNTNSNTSSVLAAIYEPLQSVHTLCRTREIRDMLDNNVTVFQLFDELFALLERFCAGSFDDTKTQTRNETVVTPISVENMLWECWLMLISFPSESDNNSIANTHTSIIASNQRINSSLLTHMHARLQYHCWNIVIDSTIEPASVKQGTTPQGNRQVESLSARHGLRAFIHWTYSHRIDLRAHIRGCVASGLMSVGTQHRGRRGDCGSSRRHVQPFLQVLSCQCLYVWIQF